MPLWTRRQTMLSALGVVAAGSALPRRAEARTPLSLLPDQLCFAVPVPTPFTSSLELDLNPHRRLVAFYRQAGAAAVLAVSACGEMLSLSWPEALRLSRQAHAVFGAARTWASVSRGDDIASCVAGIRELRSAGVGLPVVLPGLLAGAAVEAAEALRRLLAVAQASGGSLGLYEALAPFHRTLGPGDLAMLARTGVYRMLKTTQGPGAEVAALMQASGDRLGIFAANTAELAAVLDSGAAGVLDFSAAAFPELIAVLVRRWRDPGQRPALTRLARWVGATDARFLTALSFPRGVKAALALRGLPISPRSRQAVSDLTADQQATVADLVQQFRGWCRDLGVRPLV